MTRDLKLVVGEIDGWMTAAAMMKEREMALLLLSPSLIKYDEAAAGSQLCQLLTLAMFAMGSPHPRPPQMASFLTSSLFSRHI